MTKAMTRILSLLLLAGMIGLTGVACSTVDGAGRDLSHGSRWVRDKL